MTTSEKVYHSFFQPVQSSKRSDVLSPYKDQNSNINQNALALLPPINLNDRMKQANIKAPLILNPNISEPERKALEAWERELRIQNSAISDLFVGQQATTVQC